MQIRRGIAKAFKKVMVMVHQRKERFPIGIYSQPAILFTTSQCYPCPSGISQTRSGLP